MSGSLNKVMLIGNLGDEIKVHYFDDKNCIGRFPLATNETYVTRDTNERVTQTEWHRVVCRNKLAELCEKYLSKGDTVYVEGKIRTRKWNDNGVDKYNTEIYADTIQFLNTRKSGNANSNDGGNNAEASTSQKSDGSQSQTGSPNQVSPEDDLPF